MWCRRQGYIKTKARVTTNRLSTTCLETRAQRSATCPCRANKTCRRRNIWLAEADWWCERQGAVFRHYCIHRCKTLSCHCTTLWNLGLLLLPACHRNVIIKSFNERHQTKTAKLTNRLSVFFTTFFFLCYFYSGSLIKVYTVLWIVSMRLWLIYDWKVTFCISLGSVVTFFRWSGQVYSRLVLSFLRSPCTKNYWNRFIFDRVIPKIKRECLLGHSV